MKSKYKKIHFIGIGGIGVSALAKWALLDGVKISGSDAAESEITQELQKMGAKIFIGHKKENVPSGADLIVYSDAVPKDNPERTPLDFPLNKGGDRGVLQKSYFEFLGEITRAKKLIAVSGTNGKSTTTAMLGKILVDAGLDPTVIVGSKYPGFNYGNLQYGKGDLMVLEACEHNAHMLNLSPEYVVLTNIEADHLDFYKNLKNIIEAFGKYVATVPAGGFVVYNADDKNTEKIIKQIKGRKVSYGAHEDAVFRFENRRIDDGTQSLDFFIKDAKNAEFSLQSPGLFNVYNAMAAVSAAHSLGVKLEIIAKTLKNFKDLWRRFERVGEYNGAPIISDYGHHPQAIAATVLAAREFYPERRVVLAFQPHQHHRTKALFADFVRAFDGADVVILSEIYNVEGRMDGADRDISSEILAKAIVKYWETDEDHKEKKIHELYYSANLGETEAKLKEIIKKDDVVIIMGAGDIDGVARQLVKS